MERLPNTIVEDLKLRETVTNLFVLTNFPAAQNRLSVSFFPQKIHQPILNLHIKNQKLTDQIVYDKKKMQVNKTDTQALF